MKSCQVLANFTLVEADDIRKGLGKIDPKIVDKWKPEFIRRAKEFKNCPEDVAEEIFIKLARFAEYGFNLSHSAAYSITGYISQWLKVHYPIYFWSVAFKYASEIDMMNYISEIGLTGNINIRPVDINNSRDDVFTDFKAGTIFWPIISIKQVGEKASSQIIEQRDKDGQFFSLDEFLERNKFKGSKVNKSVVENASFIGKSINTVYNSLRENGVVH